MCCRGAKWKREEVPDHKFDFVDTREFTDNGFFTRLKYLFLYAVVLKSFLVYLSDIFTATTMISTKDWSNQIYKKCQENQLKGCVFVDFVTAKWIFFACIVFGFLLLAYEAHKAKKIIASRDISFAFTNVMANNYYSLRSYDHFCFFDHIKDSARLSDDFAFFVFFTFKSWKRLILSDGPRQTINAFTVYALYLAKKDLPCNPDQLASGCRPSPWYDVPKYFSGNNISTSALLISTLFTLVVFIVSLLILIVAALCYIPLLFHIQGNLKEYCCHKVDKRISEIIKRRQKQRLVEAARLAKKEAMGDYSHLKNKKGQFIAKPLPQPTLPNVSVDDEPTEASLKTQRVASPSTYTQEYQHYGLDNYPPPMPSYMPYQDQYSSHNPSSATLPNDDPYGYSAYAEHDNESTAHLASSAAPFAQSTSHFQSSHYPNGNYPSGVGTHDSHAAYQGPAGQVPEVARRTPKPSGLSYSDTDGAYQHYAQDHMGYSSQPSAYHPHPHQGRGYDAENSRGYQGGYGGGYAM